MTDPPVLEHDPYPTSTVPIWAAMWETHGPGLHLAAIDAAEAAIATDTAMNGGTA